MFAVHRQMYDNISIQKQLKNYGPVKLRDSIRIRIGRFRFHSQLTGWFQISNRPKSAASAIVPQITLIVQQKTSTVGLL